MVKISEASDGSNGDDQNKKPKDEEEENLSIPQQIPSELIELIVAIVRRCHYPKLSLISRAFRRLIASPQLYETRSHNGFTECILYAMIEIPPFELPSWFIILRSKISLRLSKVNSLLPMRLGSAVVTIGHEMYVIGGQDGVFRPPLSTVIVIDCRFHTLRSLPNMLKARYRAAAGVIDGKIYVIGGCEKQSNDWVEVFDVKNQIWNAVPGPYPYANSWRGEYVMYVVMGEKIYIFGCKCCLVYEPRRDKWESWGIGSKLWNFWHVSYCVVDDMLYAIDRLCVLGAWIVVYDPKDKIWKPVKGRFPNLVYFESTMANLGGKLVILGGNQSLFSRDYDSQKEIWCIEIALERREDGEIWGHVEFSSPVLTSRKPHFIELSRTVTV